MHGGAQPAYLPVTAVPGGIGINPVVYFTVPGLTFGDSGFTNAARIELGLLRDELEEFLYRGELVKLSFDMDDTGQWGVLLRFRQGFDVEGHLGELQRRVTRWSYLNQLRQLHQHR